MKGGKLRNHIWLMAFADDPTDQALHRDNFPVSIRDSSVQDNYKYGPWQSTRGGVSCITVIGEDRPFEFLTTMRIEQNCKDATAKWHLQRITVKDGECIIFSNSVWHRGVQPAAGNKSVIVFYYWDVDDRVSVPTLKSYQEDFAHGNSIIRMTFSVKTHS